MTIQHLRSSTANKRPTPAAMSDGQLAVNTNTASPGLFFKDSAGALIKVGPVHVGTTAPNASPASGGETGNTVGEQWLDTSGGTYVFKVWDGSAWRSESGTFVDVNGDVMTGALGIIAGSAGSPGLYFSGDTNTGIYSPGADQVAISTNSTQRLLIDASGNVNIDSNTFYVDAINNRVAIGTTSPAHAITVNSGSILISNRGSGNSYLFPDWRIYNSSSGNALVFDNYTTEAFRVDSSGRLLVGTSSARSVGSSVAFVNQIEGTGDTNAYAGQTITNNTNNLDGPYLVLGKSRGTTAGSNTIVQSNDQLGNIIFAGADGTDLQTQGASIQAFVDGTPGANDLPTRLVFSTTADGESSPTERMRINSSGQTRILGSSAPLTVRTTLAAGTSDYIFLGYRSATNMSDGVDVIDIFTNGNVVNTNNSYGAISDAKLKENIVDSGSQWSDLKSLRIRKYNFKEETGRDAHTQIGLIAQEVELVSPGLVSESPDRDAEGNDLGTVTKSVNYSVLYMKAVKALQEAMKRIETLEAKVAALESA